MLIIWDYCLSFFFLFKYEGYLVIGLGIRFKFIIERFEFYSFVMFNVVDLYGKINIFLNEKLSILELVVMGCFVFVNVLVIVE